MSRIESQFAPVALLGVVLLSLLAWPAAAAAPEPLAEVEASSNLLSFRPLVAHDAVRVTVSGPGGFEVVKTFQAGETPSIELPGSDGLYKYELRFSPALDARERAQLKLSRAADGESRPRAEAEGNTVQSGWFTILDGGVVPDRLRELEPKVTLTNGDGVIRNSLCVGFDCPDAPVFSDSTILLMENNTRIKFGDTSNAPFPNNDWEIEANSSLSGGANYLGFNDCGTADNDGGCADDVVFAVEAGARASALWVESDGDIGIGTSNPVVDIHVVTGNTPTLRLDQDGSSGFAPQVWDIAGNETNFFVRDVTGGSLLPFRIRPAAPSNSIFIDVDGDVGMGTSSPDAPLNVVETTAGDTTMLHVTANGNPRFQMTNSTNAAIDWVFSAVGAGFRISDVQDATTEFTLANNGNLTITGTLTTAGGVYPDYVFEDGYELMPLDALASFIAENRHLPNVPTAAQTGGGKSVNLSELQVKMLEKIEELTLYTLRQEETIRELEARVKALEGK